ncbi:DUF2927 domain-containing protein [Aerophototrophica crusticola]|uniref:DUF2927 domain-containing protein n=1 Tax=Aerophototrophica crusticola TaxID=1709002 RepID=A0A858R7C3_9PROT|nr:DUF2927 domain-containing protein [Rhodospirillaceae bacterium B3]
MTHRIGAALLTLSLLATPTLAAPADTDMDLMDVHVRPAERVQPTDEWIDRITGLFAEGVLKDENKRERPVTKWKGPLVIALRGDATRDFLTPVYELADELSAATGLEIEVLDRPLQRGDIDVILTWRKRYWPFFAAPVDPKDTQFTCMAIPSSAENGIMLRAEVHINAGNVGTETAKACLLEEIAQSLGLFGEVEDPSTLLNDNVGYQRLGEVDTILLKTLYDPRLVPGSQGLVALHQARRIITELVRKPQVAARRDPP